MLKQTSKTKKIAAVVAALLILWLALVNPVTSSPLLLLVPFVLLFVLIFQGIKGLLKYFSSGANVIRQKAVTWLVSLLIEVSLLLSSLGQLGLKDGLALLAIAIIGLVYIFKTIPAKAQ